MAETGSIAFVFTRLIPFLVPAVIAAACTPAPATAPYDDNTSVLAIGDSIMVAATEHLTETIDGIVVNAEEGRPFSDGLPVLESDIAANGMPDVIVVALGTNAGIGKTAIDELMDVAADGIERVIFVNVRVPRDWESSTNQRISDAADRFDTIEVVDWYAASNGNHALFRKDGYHPNTTGSELWANLIAAQIKNP